MSQFGSSTPAESVQRAGVRAAAPGGFTDTIQVVNTPALAAGTGNLVALDQIDPRAEEELARALVVKKLRSMQGLERVVQTRRLAGMLARKGYTAETSMRVIREELDARPEHQRD